MSHELLAAFVVFAVATLFTPGPNNIMLMASGLNFGLTRTLAHGFGVPLGFGFMVLVVGFGLGAFFAAFPIAYQILKYVGAAYLLYLAWRIAIATGAHGNNARARPFTFLQAAAFQWVNAKAWVMAIGAVTAYAGITAFPLNTILIAAIFTVLGTASSFTWVLFGTGLKRIVNDPRSIRIFNLVMAGLLAASLIPVFLE
jgi:threonine/homoserine/homoserine lactone efflux protein